MTINIIVAVSDNGVIGKDGKIPWKLSTDMARFDKIADETNVILGKKTYNRRPDSLYYQDRIIVSSTPQPPYIHDANGCKYITSFMPWDWIKKLFEEEPLDEFLIAGGQQIYDEIFKTPELIHRVYLTRVHCNVEGDAFFNYDFPIPYWPPIRHLLMPVKEFGHWKLIEEQLTPKSDKDEYDSTFQVWERRN